MSDLVGSHIVGFPTRRLIFHHECVRNAELSHLVGKQTMWFPNRSDTNWAVQAQKMARSLKFQI